MEFTAGQIAALLGGTVEGDGDTKVYTFAKIEEAGPGCLTFLANPKYTHYIYSTNAGAVLVSNSFEAEGTISAALIRVENPYEALSRLMRMADQALNPQPTGIEQPCFIAEGVTIPEDAYIGAFAYIGEGVELGKGVKIYPNVFVGRGSQIGEGTILYPGAKVYPRCKVGKRCIVHAGAVIGADGFGFAPTPNGYEKIPQIGIVTIEDDVEIGANTCIDRSTMGSTYVRRGVKLDNLVQIAHNCEVGENTVMSAQVGVAGSAKIGSWCMFGGQVGVAGHIRVADKTQCGAQAGIAGTVKKPGATIQGSPAIDFRNFARSSAAFKRLPDMALELRQLQAEVEELKKQLGKI